MDLSHDDRKPNDVQDCHTVDENETILLAPNGDYEEKTSVGDKDKSMDEEGSFNVEFEIVEPKPLMYRVSQNPPFHLSVLFALQQAILPLTSPLSVVLILSEVACGQDDHQLKVQLLSATLVMVGISTIMMSTVGARLPIFQGPANSYLLPLIAMQTLEEWKCPATFKSFDPSTNATILMANMGNGTAITNREVSLDMIRKMSGSLMAAGAFHHFIGVTGVVGIFIRFIGPVTIVPTLILIILKIYIIVVKFAQTDWLISAAVAIVNLILSLYLAKCNTPIPMWNRKFGFYIHWYPVHQVFSILLSLIFGWSLAAILTAFNYYPDDPEDVRFMARTDARTFTIAETNWFIFPYPGQFGPMSFSAGAFVNFLIATLISVLDSIGDYAACARVSRVSPPPPFIFNRGLAVEGLMTTFSGAMGCCHATVSYGGNIGAIGITKVASRRVFQLVGVFYILFALFGKLGAVFITVPYSVLGGLIIITIGILIGVILSFLQTVDLNSTRNLAIIGITLLLGFAIPHFIQKSPDSIDTGNSDLDAVIRMLLSNPAFVGGFLSCFLDNTVPGTLKERGLLAQMKDMDDKGAKRLAKTYEDGPETYRLPFIPKSFRRSRLARIFPMFDLTEYPPTGNDFKF